MAVQSAECISKLKGQFAWIPYYYKPQKPQQQYHQRGAAGNQMHINSRLRPTNRITFVINTKWRNLYNCTQINYKLLYVSFVHCMCALLWCNIRDGVFCTLLWNGKYVSSFAKLQSFSLGYRIKHAARYDIAITKPFFHYIVIGQSSCNVFEDMCSRRTV